MRAGGHHAAPAEEMVRAPIEILEGEVDLMFLARPFEDAFRLRDDLGADAVAGDHCDCEGFHWLCRFYRPPFGKAGADPDCVTIRGERSHAKSDLDDFAGSSGVCSLVPAMFAATPIRTLIIDGQNNHDWKHTTPVLKKILEDTGLFRWT